MMLVAVLLLELLAHPCRAPHFCSARKN